MNQALSVCEDFREARVKAQSPSSTRLQWRPPEPGSWKLNVDGTIFPNHHCSNASFVLRDDRGTMIILRTHPEQHLFEPMEVELLAIIRGMQFCLSLGILQVTVEMDFLLAVKALGEGADSVVAHRNLISKILTIKRSFV